MIPTIAHMQEPIMRKCLFLIAALSLVPILARCDIVANEPKVEPKKVEPKKVEPKKAEAKEIEVFARLKDNGSGKTSLCMWVKGHDVVVECGNPAITVGYSLLNGDVCLESNDIGNAMLTVEPCPEGASDPQRVLIVLGGIRPNDIRVKLPKGYTGRVNVNRP